MPAKKILYLVRDYPQISQTYVETEIRELRPNYNIKIISLGKPDINYNNHNPYECINDKEELARAVLDFSPDIIHGHYVLLAPVLNWASHVAQVRYTIRAHSFDVLGSNEAKLLRYAETLNSDTCLGVLTLPFTRPLFERAGIRSEKIVDCYPVVDFARFHDVSRNGDAVMNTGACLPKKNMKEFLTLATMVQGKTFNLYALGYGVERLRGFNREFGNPVNIVDPIQPENMCREYKKHEWLVYTSSRNFGTSGWPMAIAEAQAAGVGVCTQNIRPDLREYVGEAGFLFDTVDEAARIISRPFPDELRQLGFEQARKSDVRGHIHKLETLWESVFASVRERVDAGRIPLPVREAASLDPTFSDGAHAVVRKQRRHHAGRQRRPDTAPDHERESNLVTVETALDAALQHHQSGRLQHAEAIYRKILEARPSNPVALHHLGVIALQVGKNETAVDLIGKAVAHKPDYAEAHSNLGVALVNQGKLERAAASSQKAIALKPDYPDALNNLGGTLVALDKLDEAIVSYKKAVSVKPDYAEAHGNLGVALVNQGKLEQAAASFQEAIALKPDYPEALNNLGGMLVRLGKLEEAIVSYKKAVSLKPDYAEAHGNLGVALVNQGKLEQAAASFQEAIALKPDYREAFNNLGAALVALGKLDEAMVSYKKAVSLKPDDAEAHGKLLWYLHKVPGLTLEEIFAEHRRWNAQHAAPLASEIRPHTNVRDPDRRIRVGFMSRDFRRRPVGYLITPALEARDPAAWELYCYSSGGISDDLTERIRAAADVWREIGGTRDDAVARLVRDDEIDILVDLIGHARGDRLLVFARKPAPVQVKWVGGQCNTTGIDAMDYFLSDPVETPEGAEKWFSEEVIRLPDGYVCYAPPEFAPEVAPLPALDKGYTTFGCFTPVVKINGEVVALWARLLRRLPTARLVLKTLSLGDPGVRERYHAMFEAHGVARERVDLLPRSPHTELLAHYNEIDIALDTFPYSCGLTTCEALWMGIPVVTLGGETFAARHSASHLHNVGLGDWVVQTPEDYVTLAEQWSRDADALAGLRAGLRGRMAASPLCDGPRFAANLETAFRTMWRRWCEGSAPSPRDPA